MFRCFHQRFLLPCVGHGNAAIGAGTGLYFRFDEHGSVSKVDADLVLLRGRRPDLAPRHQSCAFATSGLPKNLLIVREAAAAAAAVEHLARGVK